MISGLVKADIEVKKQELTKLQKHIKKISNNIEFLGQEKNFLQKELSDLEIQYGAIAGLLKKLKRRISDVKKNIANVQQDIAKQKSFLKKQLMQLQGQIKAAYAMGKTERLKLIFNQQDPAVSSRILVYYDYFNKARLDKLKLIDKSIQLLVNLELDQQKEKKDLERLVLQQDKERQKLLTARQERNAVLTKLNSKFSLQSDRLSELKHSEKKLLILISSLQEALHNLDFTVKPGKPFAMLKGKMIWPVKGKILENFASKRADSPWNGVLIAAKEGDEVRGISHGRVVYSNWLRGYGLLLIIDHGQDYMSLYAFNQSLHKNEGDWVNAGDVIASVGKSGGRKQTGLYFGIRVAGKPLDPVKWCQKNR